MSNETTSLYQRHGTTDKVYHIDLVAAGDAGFLVNTRWGGRSWAKLRSGTETEQPVPYEEAKSIYKSAVNRQLRKGYTLDESGTPYQGTSKESQVSGIMPQLLNPVDDGGLESLMQNDQYVLQTKHNGERRLIRVGAAGVEGINRKGLLVALPSAVAEAAAVVGDHYILDGEIVGDVVYAFDLLADDEGSVRHRSFHERHLLLKARLSRLQDAQGAIRLVETAFFESQKRELFARIKAENGEGVVLKLKSAHYVSGRPNSGGTQFKYPFYASATCRVASHHSTKRSVGIEVRGNGEWVSVGNVMIPANHPVPPIHSLCEVRYLYAHPEGSLLQPVYQGQRGDLSEEDATLEQLKYLPLEGDEE